MTTVAVVTRDVVGSRMAGPGIRALHTAVELSKRFPTTLVARFVDFDSAGPLTIAEFGSREATAAIREAAVVVSQPIREVLSGRREGRVVYDLFDPVIIELDALYAPRPTVRQRLHRFIEARRLRAALRSGDALIAATPAQKSFYEALEPSSARRRWIAMPFGIDEAEPLAGAVPEVLRGDPRPVIVWGGGTWKWLDPETAIRAVTRLNSEGFGCRLLFLGAARPLSGTIGAADGTIAALSRDAGDSVIWNEDWVPYAERARWLRASRAAIMLHREGAEGPLSIRTRLFDAIWCGLPVIATEGGFAADLVKTEGLGVVVKASDAGEVASAIRRLVGDDAFHARSVSNLARLRPRYVWPRVVAPLAETIAEWC